jgi:hypothetical protein
MRELRGLERFVAAFLANCLAWLAAGELGWAWFAWLVVGVLFFQWFVAFVRDLWRELV